MTIQQDLPRRKRIRLLREGNTKLGDGVIWTWSLPAIATCHWATSACTRECYGLRGHYRRQSTRLSLYENLNQLMNQPLGWAERVLFEIDHHKVECVRIHVVGDFFADWYILLWETICEQRPDVRFYWYTRSWRGQDLVPHLKTLASLPNVQGWYSCDIDTGLPAPDLFPVGSPNPVKVCWLLTMPGEKPPPGVDLVFRTQRLRKKPQKRISLALICPQEQKEHDLGSIPCQTCGICLPKEVEHGGRCKPDRQ